MSKDLPAIPDKVDGELRRALVRMREELQALMGTRGSDPAVRLMQITGGAGGGALVFLPGTGPGGGVDAPDLTPPPTPTFGPGDAFGGISQVIVTWSGINYTQGHGNKQTIVYAVKKDPSDPTMPTFPGDASIVAIAPHALTIIAIPSEPNTRWHIWLKFESIDGVQSTSPAGGTNGVQATTGQDVQHLLEVLTNKIREDQLYSALVEPIRSIVQRADDAAEDALRAALATHTQGRRTALAMLKEASNRGTAITQTRTLIAEGDAQLAGQITLLTSRVGDNLTEARAAVEDEAEARASGDGAQATARQALSTALVGAPDPSGLTLGTITSGLLYYERTTRSAETGALAVRAELLEASVDTPGTGLLARATALETITTDVSIGNSALAYRTGLLEATVNDAGSGVAATAAALDVVKTLVNDGASGVVALATRTSTLEARVTTPSATPGNPAYNVTYAALQTEQSTRAALDGSVQALYTVRTELSAAGNRVVGGFGLSGTASATEGPRINFGVRADRFYIAAPGDGSAPGFADVLPFIVQTANATVNGVFVPAGTYIADAFIRNGTITNAKIGNAAIDDAKVANLSAAKLTVGDGTVGGDLKSTSYVPASGSGWLLQPGGNAFFNNAVVYGTVYASAGAIGGNTINATGIQSPGYTVGSTGFRFDTSGLLRAFGSSGARVLDLAATGSSPVLKVGSAIEILANGTASFQGGGTFSGALSAASGTFSGNLSAAGGTFAGTLTAEGVITSFLVAPNTIALRRFARRTTTETISFGGDADYQVYHQVTLAQTTSFTLDSLHPADVFLAFVYKANVTTTAGISGTASARVRLLRNSTTIWTSESHQSDGTFSTDDAGGIYLDQSVSGATTYTLLVEAKNEYLAGWPGPESFHTLSALSATLIAVAYQR